MFGLHATIVTEVDRVRKAAQAAAKHSFRYSAFKIRQTAVQSIEQARGPSAPGTPPHTHRRKWLQRSIFYSANKTGAVIGPRASYVGTAGAAHEFGGEFRGQEYPERQFMKPALDANLDLFAGSWAGRVTE